MDANLKALIDKADIATLGEIAEYSQGKLLNSLKKGDAVHVAHRSSWVGWNAHFISYNADKGTALIGYLRKEAGEQSQNVDAAYVRPGEYPVSKR